MKSFVEYLTESKKTYDFKIGIAGELPEGCVDKLETSLQKFGVANMSSGKKTPIQERPLDFPQLSNMEVTYYEVSLNYPTTRQVLEQYIPYCCDLPVSHVIVRGVGEAQEEYQEPKSNEPYEALLTKEELEDGPVKDPQSTAGTTRVMDLLKELEQVRKERDNDPMEGAPVGESTDIDDSENSKSPLGS